MYAHILTLIFIAAKLQGLILWSWWLVLAPSLFVVGVYLITGSAIITMAAYLVLKPGANLTRMWR